MREAECAGSALPLDGRLRNCHFSASTSEVLTVVVNPVAQAPSLSMVNAEGNEGGAIALGISSALPANDAATGALTVTITGLPSGATLTEAEVAYVCEAVAEVREERG